MRLTGLLPLLLAAAPAVDAARGKLGFSLGNRNADGSCKSREDYENDFDALKDLTNLVRTYSGTECHTPERILPAAKAKNFKVVLGIWVGRAPSKDDEGTNDASFKGDWAAVKNAISTSGQDDAVHAITVGSEALYRGDLTGPQLHRYIKVVHDYVTKELKNDKLLVGTADSWNKFADGTADSLFTEEPIVKYVYVESGPFLHYISRANFPNSLSNAFAYWQGHKAEESHWTYFDDMSKAMQHIQKVAGDKADQITVVNGETGWPTDGGSDYEAAKAGTQNAKTFWRQGVCGMLAWGVDLFYFEGFDESWKPDSKGDNGKMADEKHWGLFKGNRDFKFDTACPK
ncbi:Glycoside hydrolase superfamily [Penicillium alfredii]|uniref:glucan 1,3-beta-glucosidase n=1 Tax=Penicillium alfredii TaxID=1506179 RepID=A0A9W9F1A6_9EURO|nr:Glycoside hydrolase superfamily [Penicillium alfredii]KAJ5091760.1 Glycoside hydrolase superfamily [Penicillium alfredii]